MKHFYLSLFAYLFLVLISGDRGPLISIASAYLFSYILKMRPGLTSMATIHNGYTDTMEKMLIRLEMDLDYLRKRSLWLDAKLIFTTFFYIVNGKKF